MVCFQCNSWLHFTFIDNVPGLVYIQMCHDLAHERVTDISIPKDVIALIENNRELTPSAIIMYLFWQIWDVILKKYKTGKLTDKNWITEHQVYARWSKLNERVWRLNHDEVTSAQMLLKQADGGTVEIIPISEEEGRSSFAYAFKDSLRMWGAKAVELCVDSMFKMNAAGYKLFAFVAEANGQSLPLTFLFTRGVSESKGSAKQRILMQVLIFLRRHLMSIRFTISDKDPSEIGACQVVFPSARHSICYWNIIKYVKERLAENKPSAAYDPRKVHGIFPFINPTWFCEETLVNILMVGF
ncbi:hypothetical protein PUNSTDRAFT_75677 [Punctularia strigosozonata HHB-11173 SS5]|uniref:MULE transposase domain-containing protein n=1 Tax=Punctularia strigosozonata (strain HHB-11173) TaxID=741275 RepID=R7S4U8_PUNST|nr:uncharacterized protein PUNSTDRAFT_75677 [Punctularia strigosozonata HHB-11173 SS5]EIN04914.1 hypothetical protein PUNSTDRAFT_75677 [Punctularia strigosozonata HHB-11173 SS5]